MKMRIPTFILFTSLGLLAACGESPQADAGGQTAGNSQPSPAQPARQVEFRIPPEHFETDPQRGRELFTLNCAQCHGREAQGTYQGPPLIHRVYEPSHHSDLAFYRAIALGVHQHHWNFGDMPPVAGVSGEDAAHIIAWIRQEQRKAGID